MKKLLLILLCALAIPTIGFAATAVPWQLSSTTDTAIFPSLVNGSNKGVRVQGTATSSFSGSVGFGLVNPARAQVEIQATTTTTGSHALTIWNSSDANIFDVDGAGTLNIAGNFLANNVTTLGRFIFSGSSQIFGGAIDGGIQLTNSAANNFSRLQFGGTTNAFPALNINTATQAVSVGLADGSLGGRFGVGTSTPYAKLAINLDANDAAEPAFVIASSTASATSTLFFINSVGQVGQGGITSFAGSTGFEANGSILVANTQQLGSAADGNARWTPETSVGNNSLFSTLNNTIWNVAPGTELMRLTSGGNLGIGTSSPAALLSISNSVATAGATPLLLIASTTAGTATTTLLSLNNTGLLGVGVDTGTILANGLSGSSPGTPSIVVNSNVVNGAGGIGFASNGTLAGFIQANPAQMTFTTGNNNTGYRFLNQNGLLMNLSGTGTLIVGPNGGNVIPFLGVGTSSPYAELSIATPNGFNGATQSLFVIASSTAAGTTTLLKIDNMGHHIISGPTPSFGACGTSPSFVGAANDRNMTFNVGSGLVSSCAINFANSFPANSTVTCSLTQINGAAVSLEASTTPTGVTVSGGTFTSDRLSLQGCEANI